MIMRGRLYLLALAAWFVDFIRNKLPGGQFIWYFLDLALLLKVDIFRCFSGSRVARGLTKCRRPEKPLELYEFEGCPYCRKVREALSVLAIDHIVYPCPRETLKAAGHCLNSRYRPVLAKLGGKLQFPYIVDPNTETRIYESSGIVEYLWKTYGSEASPPLSYRLGQSDLVFKWTALPVALSRPCPEMGILRAPSHMPSKPLEFWGYEGSCFCRRVREVLSSLELPYMYHEMAHGATAARESFRHMYSTKFSQRLLRKIFGLVQVPFLKDPNTKVEMFESSNIVEYLRRQYQTADVPRMESWLDYGSAQAKKSN